MQQEQARLALARALAMQLTPAWAGAQAFDHTLMATFFDEQAVHAVSRQVVSGSESLLSLLNNNTTTPELQARLLALSRPNPPSAAPSGYLQGAFDGAKAVVFALAGLIVVRAGGAGLGTVGGAS